VDAGWGIASSWNTRILQSYIQQTYGVSMSREGIRKLLHRLRLSWTRPTYKPSDLQAGQRRHQASSCLSKRT
ncbi:helix-turn-helix domain-containing protein, partial [Anoxybacillus kestanbolensis]|uniref:helix-turn-helix domain-containing protein n=1 Tax=Anoxybacillus kestanbolensis TaxID=227476 RepID=UPI003D1A4015